MQCKSVDKFLLINMLIIVETESPEDIPSRYDWLRRCHHCLVDTIVRVLAVIFPHIGAGHVSVGKAMLILFMSILCIGTLTSVVVVCCEQLISYLVSIYMYVCLLTSCVYIYVLMYVYLFVFMYV